MLIFGEKIFLSSHDNAMCIAAGGGEGSQGRHIALVDMKLSAKPNLITWVAFFTQNQDVLLNDQDKF